MKNTRDFNKEFDDGVGRKYAYNFDFDVMHHYMIETFRPLIRGGTALELGSFKGDFTRRLLPMFESITCVEASSLAINEAKAKLPPGVRYLEGTFETIKLEEKIDNIFLTHVLEHVDDAVGVLRRINDEWLSDTGRLFLVCPNANAPSRQIAVKMGLISHNAAITPGEAQHGHHRTYSLDTMERDAVAAGLKVIQRSGIFFKAFANFQWDKILQTDIVSEEYLEGCYQLGQVYPDLCASIFLLCEKGSK
jgi:2-polyprenyl-3-methyl-5-hydroxy-6-metoxy-1,4-benzoquinol methylase